MKNTIILLCTILSLKSFGQTLKIYNGNYKNGTAKYSYIENKEYQRIFEGDFIYKNNFSTISGHYKNNMKGGPWEYLYNFNGNKVRIEASYDNDKKFSFWTVFQTFEYSKENYFSTLVFNQNDTLTGNINFRDINGHLDDKGNFTGKWNLSNNDKEFVAVFSNNILTKLIHRNKEDGKILSKYILEHDSIELKSDGFYKTTYNLQNYKSEIFENAYGLSMENKDEEINSLKLFYSLINVKLINYFEDLKLLDLKIIVKNPCLAYLKSYKVEVNETDKIVNDKSEEDSNTVIKMSEDQTIYNAVEVKPDFPGGIAKFYNYVSKNFKLPAEKKIDGKVIVQFVVEKDGSLTDVHVLRDLGFGTGEEAIRVLNNSPKWKPGIQNGRPVRVRYNLPISLVN